MSIASTGGPVNPCKIALLWGSPKSLSTDPLGVKNIWHMGPKITTVKLLYNDHPWDPKIVAVVDRQLLLSWSFSSKSPK
jgi:hypothetical protein